MTLAGAPRRLALPLQTGRLLLRDMEVRDWPGVLRYSGDPKVARFQPWDPADEAGHRAYFDHALASSRADPRREYCLAVEHRADGRMLGTVALTLPVPWDGRLGYFLERAAWGQGYATEAARALVSAAFDQLGLHRLWATCAPENLTSVRVLEKLGMRREGHLRRHFRLRHGWRDSYIYALLGEEWRRLTADRMALSITTVTGRPREELARQQLVRLLAQYDLRKWRFTDRVQIQTMVVPHSHPVLTLNTRSLADDRQALATYLHEQLHWFTAQQEMATQEAITELEARYPTVPGPEGGGAESRGDTYQHLVVCALEYQSLIELLGPEAASAVIAAHGVYTWIYATVRHDWAFLAQLLRRHGLVVGYAES